MITGDNGSQVGVPRDGARDPAPIARNVKARQDGRREEMLREIQRLRTEIERLGRDAVEQGSLRDPGEEGVFVLERARLQKRLDALRRDLNPTGPEELTPAESAAVGRRVTIRLPDGGVETWELTTPSQANPKAERISVRSPLGRALIVTPPGSTTSVETPEDSYVVEVLEAA